MLSSALNPPAAEASPQLREVARLFRSGGLAEASRLCDGLVRGARETAAPAGDALEAEASYWAVRCARRREHPDAAMALAYAGLAAARRSGQAQIECLLRAELVHVLSSLGQNDEAFEEADAALRRAKHLQSPVGEAALHEALASVFWMTNDWEPGFEAYTHALAMAVACGSLELQVLCTLGLAACAEGVAQIDAAAGRPAEARERFLRSVHLQRESARLATLLGDEHLAMYAQLNCGCSLHSLGEPEAAREVLEGCLADPRREAVHGNALSVLGRMALERGDAQLALAQLQRALAITERLDKPYPMLIVLKALADAHEAVGDLRAALACMRRLFELHVKNASDKARRLARAMAVKYDTERAIAVAQAQRERADSLERSNADLAQEAAQHERTALEDALTGVANRRRFDQALQSQAVAGAGLRPCSVALLDLDHFKRINDHFSHLVGDEVLRRVGALLAANCRRDDLVARYGGEEFVLLAGEATPDEMGQVCERIRAAVEREPWSALRPGLQVTVSIGVAHHDEIEAAGPAAAQALVALADARLYAAKQRGRNQVCTEGGATPHAEPSRP